jgi:hypothetical protein
MIPMLDPTDPFKKYWEPLGQYVNKFGALERFVDECLSDLMEAPYKETSMLLGGIDFLSRAKLLRTFCQETSVENEMKGLFIEIEEQNSFRNHLIRGDWIAISPSNYKRSEIQKLKMSLDQLEFDAGGETTTSLVTISIELMQTNTSKLKDLIARVAKTARAATAERASRQAVTHRVAEALREALVSRGHMPGS